MGPKKAPAPSKGGKISGKPKPDVTKKATPKAGGKGAEAAAAPKLPPPPEPEKVGLKQVAGVVMDDPEGKIKGSKWWAYCVDEKGVVGRFMQMRDVNVINALDKSQMDQEVIRKAILGALRYGKPFVFDQMEADMYESLCTLMDGILPGLMGLILNKTIMETEK
ncbi:hypothetical protein FSP39_004114 [Pinctada imbricata]|uniref:Uncharacterized protein n=1 Tax=Pinctada imbricata TaxID=66713 RepID=A0AA89BPS7_PINIB|nr:hypothetical protein FSP39_004114 [Pinctada imbricata]